MYISDKMTGKYIVMTNYGLEGWKISGQSDTFEGALLIQKESSSNGNDEVFILKPVKMKIVEVQD